MNDPAFAVFATFMTVVILSFTYAIGNAIGERDAKLQVAKCYQIDANIDKCFKTIGIDRNSTK